MDWDCGSAQSILRSITNPMAQTHDSWLITFPPNLGNFAIIRQESPRARVEMYLTPASALALGPTIPQCKPSGIPPPGTLLARTPIIVGIFLVHAVGNASWPWLEIDVTTSCGRSLIPLQLSVINYTFPDPDSHTAPEIILFIAKNAPPPPSSCSCQIYLKHPWLPSWRYIERWLTQLTVCSARTALDKTTQTRIYA